MDNLEYSEKIKLIKIRCMFAIGLERVSTLFSFFQLLKRLVVITAVLTYTVMNLQQINKT